MSKLGRLRRHPDPPMTRLLALIAVNAGLPRGPQNTAANLRNLHDF
jgi:hypothetical protein